MITLKLSTYTTDEVNKLAELFNTMQPILHQHCTQANDCKTCGMRHLCMDLNQATMYAEEYIPQRK